MKVAFEHTAARQRAPTFQTPQTSFPKGTLKIKDEVQARIKPEGKMLVSYNRIEHAKWRELYGTKTENGKTTNLCWYSCNRPGGCNNAACPSDHREFPIAYKGKPLMQSPKDFQEEVLRKCGGT